MTTNFDGSSVRGMTVLSADRATQRPIPMPAPIRAALQPLLAAQGG